MVGKIYPELAESPMTEINEQSTKDQISPKPINLQTSSADSSLNTMEVVAEKSINDSQKELKGVIQNVTFTYGSNDML